MFGDSHGAAQRLDLCLNFLPFTSSFRESRQLRARRRVKSAKQQEELFDYGKKMFRDGLGCVRIRFWNYGALKRRYRYD